MMGAFGVIENSNHVFTKDNKVIFSAKEQGYYDALAYLNDLYKEGLIDKDVSMRQGIPPATRWECWQATIRGTAEPPIRTASVRFLF